MFALCILAGLVTAETPDPGRSLVIVQRTVTVREGGYRAWQVDYLLRYDGEEPLVIPPGTVSARVEGNVSHSAVPGHEVPRQSTVEAGWLPGFTAAGNLLIDGGKRDHHCRERLTMLVWPAEGGADPPYELMVLGVWVPRPRDPPVRSVPPGGMVRVRLLLEHAHPFYGPFHVLLGERTVEVEMGGAMVRDRLPLCSEPRWKVRPLRLEPEEDWRDTRIFFSAPASLHLRAHEWGRETWRHSSYVPVKPGSVVRLSFRYLVAAGTQATCRARVSQVHDTPTAWRTCYDAERDLPLAVVGRWTPVDTLVRVDPQANLLTVSFRVVLLQEDVSVGELWIDDLELSEPYPVTGP